MKVESTPLKEKSFEPFSMTVTFESPEEACALWHRLNTPDKNIHVDHNKVSSPNVSPGILDLFIGLNQLMFKRGISKIDIDL